MAGPRSAVLQSGHALLAVSQLTSCSELRKDVYDGIEEWIGAVPSQSLPLLKSYLESCHGIHISWNSSGVGGWL